LMGQTSKVWSAWVREKGWRMNWVAGQTMM
jgi:hypothetical protein